MSEELHSVCVSNFKYPKPLPELDNKTIYNEVGFSDLEIVTLRNLWRLVKPHKRRHALNILKEFYSTNEHLIDNYRDANGVIQTTILCNHTYKVLQLYDNLIENAIGNPRLLHVVLSGIYQKHKMNHVSRERFLLYGESINFYLLRIFRKYATPTLSKALEKLVLCVAKEHPIHLETNERDANELGQLRKRILRSTTLEKNLADSTEDEDENEDEGTDSKKSLHEDSEL